MTDNHEEMTEVPSHYVGIGASAGGLEALQEFFGHIPSDTGAVFIVAQHLSPDYKSMMPELLSRYTKMPIAQASDGVELLANHVYLMPPRKNMMLGEGRLLLSDQVPDTQPQMPIDFFLRSLAENYQHKAVGVVLSGTGSDGTRGIKAMKEAGGLVMIQEPASAKFDGMPMSAYSTGLADLLLPPDEMGDSLVSYFRHPFISGKKPLMDNTSDEETSTLENIFQLLRNQSAINFSHYKASTVARRIERRLGINQLATLNAYHRLLVDSPRELQTLGKELLIGVTRFFRDEKICDRIEKEVVPTIVSRAIKKNEPVRIWVAGCSTGEEAYSLAMMFNDYIAENKLVCRVHIFATDVDAEAIAEASSGRYPLDIEHDMNEDRLRKYFVRKEGAYVVSPRLREMVIFATHNMLEDPPFSHIDLVSCRNVLIYFQHIAQKKVLASLFFALRQHGVLWLGPSESLGDLQTHFEVVDERRKIFRKVSNQRVPIGATPPGLSANGRFPVNQVMPVMSSTSRPAKTNGVPGMDTVTERIIEEYAPDSIILNAQFDAVHVYGDVGDYVKPFRPGKVTNNIKDIVVDDLAVAVSTALYRCEKNSEDVFYEDVSVSARDGKDYLIDLSVLYVNDKDIVGSPVFYAVQFLNKNQELTKKEKEKISFNASEHSRQRIRDLELELVKKQEHLQVTIEELETTNEELQSANEELMSANEELQSTNEELQSVNEELYTVNSEYQEKIAELTEANDDLDSVINATNIGIVFLDRTLSIRKFTPVSTNYIHLRDNDVGRPFHHISHELKYPDIMTDIAHVSKEGVTIEKSISSNADHALLIRILPYRYSGSGAQSGVVLTLTNISRQRFVEGALERAQESLRSSLLDDESEPATLPEAPVRVLVLEDDDVDRRRVVRMLRMIPDRQYRVSDFSRIDEAIGAASSEEFDVLLVDFQLAEGTAQNFSDAIREKNISTPIILMSGYDEAALDSRFLDADIFDFLNKDELTTQLLVRSLDYVMEKKARQAEDEKQTESSGTGD
ncbi:chemotaxis protein CheB [uncultured Thalassolituus sp.]|uniref:chemotaxis protein CheB n=1 Tax=uncultured Thalassolituus sp. TaxID=285273 RepID=UPI00260549B6|nr:chemotaxis protein CheB [uncultured Thalassolituus sp.]